MSAAGIWMPLYVGDYLSATGHLSTAEHGAYMLLLLHSWKNGPLPDEDARLATIARTDAVSWKVMASTIRAFLTQTPAGLVQSRLEKERVAAIANANRRSSAASKAAQARWAPAVAGHAIALPAQCERHLSANASGNTSGMPDECPPPSPSDSDFIESFALSSPAGPEDATPVKVKADRAKAKVSNAMLDEAAAIWNAAAAEFGLAQVSHMTDARRHKLRFLLLRHLDNDLHRWKRYVAAIGSNDFLTGGGAKGWRADFDWACREKNLLATREGKYDASEVQT